MDIEMFSLECNRNVPRTARAVSCLGHFLSGGRGGVPCPGPGRRDRVGVGEDRIGIPCSGLGWWRVDRMGLGTLSWSWLGGERKGNKAGGGQDRAW